MGGNHDGGKNGIFVLYAFVQNGDHIFRNVCSLYCAVSSMLYFPATVYSSSRAGHFPRKAHTLLQKGPFFMNVRKLLANKHISLSGGGSNNHGTENPLQMDGDKILECCTPDKKH